MIDQSGRALLTSSAADYARFGLDRDAIAAWEDGARTDNRAGTYEWWYFDAHLDDGARLVVIFMNKDLTSIGRPLSPLLRLNLDLPDGRSFEKMVAFRPEQWSAAKDHADVRIGGNRFQGDLHEYRIQAAAEGISLDVTLRSEIPAWRPGTGYMLFGQRRDLEFGWFPSVPKGRVSGSYTVDGQIQAVSGIGYHDHNWGNVRLDKIVHHWYWARGQAGPYTAICWYITPTKKYSHQPVTLFMLARDGQIVADDASFVRFEPEGVYADEKTHKPVAATIRYIYEKGDESIEVAFTRKHDLFKCWMIEDLAGLKKAVARLVGFDGAYLRFAGQIAVTASRAGTQTEHFTGEAIWELMYFGHAPKTISV